MQINCSVSLGELVDKITILEIKIAKIEDSDKVLLATSEHRVLSRTLEELKLVDLASKKSELKQINETLWKIEDDIREKELSSEFDQEFIDLARLVYITNDKRFIVKNSINMLYNCEIKEVKSYKG